MNIFRLYRSKKYLQRIIISFSLLVMLLVSVFSIVLYYNAEKVVLTMQKDSNKKVLSQIQFNIAYLNGVIPKLMSTLYYDSNVIALMSYRENSDLMEALINRTRMDKIADYTPFIHSIVVYNGNMDHFFWGGDAVFQDTASPIYAQYRNMFKSELPIPKLEMVPMRLEQSGEQVDFFSIFNYESFKYQAGQSIFILNIKPQWLFDNIKLINNLVGRDKERILIMGKNGDILTSDKYPASVGALNEAMAQHKLKAANDKNGYFNYSLDNKKMIVNYLDTGLNGWTLISMQPYETLLKKVNALKTTSIILTLIFILLSLMAILGVSHRLYRPLGKLFYSMRQDTNDETELLLGKNDELSYMSSVYQQTMKKLLTARNEQGAMRSISRSYYTRLWVTDSLSLSQDQMESLIVEHKLNIDPTGPYILGIMKLDNQVDFANYQDENERKLLNFAIANITQEILSERFQCEMIEMKNEHIIAVVSLKQGMTAPDNRVKLEIAKAQETFNKLFRTSFSVALSEEIFEYKTLSHQYQLVLQALRYTLVFDDQSIIVPAMISSNLTNTETSIAPELEKKLLESIRAHQDEAFEKTLERIFAYVATLNYEYIVYMVLHIFILMKSAIKEMSDNRIVSLSIDLAEVNQKILDSKSLNQMKKILIALYREITENKKSPESDRNEVLLDTIKEIIDQSYTDVNLSLQKICDTMKLSPDFIGKLFKKNHGVSIAEHINDVRLRQAVHLLEVGNYSINELIDRIGFSTPSSFFRLFKNKYGTTPKEYRIKRNISD